MHILGIVAPVRRRSRRNIYTNAITLKTGYVLENMDVQASSELKLSISLVGGCDRIWATYLTYSNR